MRRAFLLSLLAIGAVSLLPPAAVAAKPALSIGDAAVAEPASSVVVEFKLSKKANKKVKATWSTADGSAEAGADYGASSGTIKIRARKRKARVEIPIAGDSSDEDAEAFEVRLDSVKRAKIGDGTGEVTIADDDPPPQLSLDTVSVAEGNAPTQQRMLTVSLSEVSGKPVGVDYATASGTAVSGEDFVAADDRLEIPAGEAAGTIPLTTVGDDTDEDDEQLEIAFAGAANAVAPAAGAGITILDDDLPPTISISPASITEGTEGNHARTLTATLSAASSKPITVDYSTPSGGTAIQGTDYIVASGALSFAPGDTEDTFDVSTVGDYDDESDEAFPIGFSNPVNLTLPATAPSVTITDDDPPCTTASTPGSAINLGTTPGDSGSTVLTSSSSISPCLDTDWFQFTLSETSGATSDLAGVITLETNTNDSPNQGNLTLCAQVGAAGTPSCSTEAAGVEEGIDLCVADVVGPDNTTVFFIEVKGSGNAVNDYDLTVTGNNQGANTVLINVGC